MEKVARKFRSFREAEEADREFYRSLSGPSPIRASSRFRRTAMSDYATNFAVLALDEVLAAME